MKCMYMYEMYVLCMYGIEIQSKIYIHSLYIHVQIYAIYIVGYKNGIYEYVKYTIFCRNLCILSEVYAKCIQDIFSCIFQHIFISMWVTVNYLPINSSLLST